MLIKIKLIKIKKKSDSVGLRVSVKEPFLPLKMGKCLYTYTSIAKSGYEIKYLFTGRTSRQIADLELEHFNKFTFVPG